MWGGRLGAWGNPLAGMVEEGANSLVDKEWCYLTFYTRCNLLFTAAPRIRRAQHAFLSDSSNSQHLQGPNVRHRTHCLNRHKECVGRLCIFLTDFNAASRF